MTCNNHQIFEDIAAALNDTECQTEAGQQLMRISNMIDQLREAMNYIHDCYAALGSDDLIPVEQQEQMAQNVSLTVTGAVKLLSTFGSRNDPNVIYTQYNDEDDGGHPVLIS